MWNIKCINFWHSVARSERSRKQNVLHFWHVPHSASFTFFLCHLPLLSSHIYFFTYTLCVFSVLVRKKGKQDSMKTMIQCFRITTKDNCNKDLIFRYSFKISNNCPVRMMCKMLEIFVKSNYSKVSNKDKLYPSITSHVSPYLRWWTRFATRRQLSLSKFSIGTLCIVSIRSNKTKKFSRKEERILNSPSNSFVVNIQNRFANLQRMQ